MIIPFSNRLTGLVGDKNSLTLLREKRYTDYGSGTRIINQEEKRIFSIEGNNK